MQKGITHYTKLRSQFGAVRSARLLPTIKDSKPDEKFIKTVQKSAAAKGMTVAEYRDKILFSHGKEKIIKRFKQFFKLHPEAEGKPKPPLKNYTSAVTTKKFVSKK